MCMLKADRVENFQHDEVCIAAYLAPLISSDTDKINVWHWSFAVYPCSVIR